MSEIVFIVTSLYMLEEDSKFYFPRKVKSMSARMAVIYKIVPHPEIKKWVLTVLNATEFILDIFLYL